LYYKKHWSAAIRVFEDGVALPGGWDSEKCQSLCFIGECWLHLNNIEKSVVAFTRALGYDASRREPWLQLAKLYQRKGNVAATRGFTYAAIAFPKIIGLYENDHNYSTIPEKLLKWCGDQSSS